MLVAGYVVSNNSQNRHRYEDQNGFPRHFTTRPLATANGADIFGLVKRGKEPRFPFQANSKAVRSACVFLGYKDMTSFSTDGVADGSVAQHGQEGFACYQKDFYVSHLQKLNKLARSTKSCSSKSS
jgi:hypothetical protein